MPANIQALINKQDSTEIVRDKIAQIVTDEVASQKVLATEAGENPALWDLKVLLESSNPLSTFMQQLSEGGSLQDLPPVLNVWLDNATPIAGGSNTVSTTKMRAIYNLDIYGYAYSEDDGAGHIPGDFGAAIDAQRGARLVRNILMSGYYKNLDLKSIVCSRGVQSLDAFQPQLNNNSVEKVQAVRLSFIVELIELAPEYTGEDLEVIHVDIHRGADGFLLAQAEYDLTL